MSFKIPVCLEWTLLWYFMTDTDNSTSLHAYICNIYHHKALCLLSLFDLINFEGSRTVLIFTHFLHLDI